MSDTSATDGAGEHRFRWRLAAIAGAALVLRVLYVFLVTGDQPIAQSDALYYSAQAVTVGDGRGFTEPYDPARSGPRADHPPLTAIVAAPATWLPDGQWLGQARFQVGQRLTMALIGSMTVFMVGLFTRRTLRARPAAERGGPSPEDAPADAPVDDSVAVPENAPAGGDAGRSNRGHRLGIHPERAGLLAAGIAALSPNLWVHDGLVMSESIGALTLVLALWMAGGAWERPSVGRWFGVGAVQRSASCRVSMNWPISASVTTSGGQNMIDSPTPRTTMPRFSMSTLTATASRPTSAAQTAPTPR